MVGRGGGAARLFQEGTADRATDGWAASAKLRRAGLVLLQSAPQQQPSARPSCFARAALAFLHAADALSGVNGAKRESLCKLYCEAAEIVERGLGEPREAACCYILGASATPSASGVWTSAAAAMQRAADFEGRGSALGALRNLSERRETDADVGKITQIALSHEALCSWLTSL